MVCAHMTVYTRLAFLSRSNSPVNCSPILIFLQNSACYTIHPDMHQWYRINNQEITDTHYITIYNDKTVHIVQLPTARPNETNAVETFARLSIQNNPTKSKPTYQCTAHDT